MKNLLDIFQKIGLEISDLFNNGLKEKKESSSKNESGDLQDAVDLMSNDVFKRNLSNNNEVHSFASEEENSIVNINKDGKYFIVFDPLDGSQNIEPNLVLGSIFGIFETSPENIQDGRQMIAAGYILYGPALQLVFADKENVKLYRYNRKTNEYEVENNDINIPDYGKFYSVNESNNFRWINQKINKYIEVLKNNNKSNRWDGCMVADVHRILQLGGVFTYPRDLKSKEGKLRLLYECYPMSFIIERLGGKSITDDDKETNILDIPFNISKIHQKTPIILMSRGEYDDYCRL